MKRSTKYKIISTGLLGVVLFSYNQCITPLSKTQKNTLKFSSDIVSSPTGAVAGASRATSIDGFSKTVYPVTRAHCISCHGSSQTPLHASSDINTAYDALINSSKVDFSNPANSRIVMKIKNEKHNCWGDCNSNSDEMLSQVTSWKNLISTTGSTSASNGKTTEESLTIQNVLDPNNSSSTGGLTLIAEAASLKFPMSIASELGTTYVWTPAAAGTKDLTNTDAGNAIFNFNILTSDFYKVFMYVNAPSDTADSLFVKVTGSDYKDWTIGSTVGFEWRELTNTPQKLQTDFYLTGNKSYQLELRQKEPGVKVSKVVVTNDMNFDPSAMKQINQKSSMTFPLSNISGVANSFLDVDIEEYDQYSYKISNARIRTSVSIQIKSMKVLVNGSFNPQHATYTVVDKIVSSSDSVVSPYSMILLKDKGNSLDKISFSFEVIQAASK